MIHCLIVSKISLHFYDDVYCVSQSFPCQMTGSAVFYLQFTEMEPIIHMLCKIIWNKGLNLGAQCRSCNSNLWVQESTRKMTLHVLKFWVDC